MSIYFHKSLHEAEKYEKVKTDIKNQAKMKIRQITQKKQREELLEQRRKEGKEDFLWKDTLDVQGVNVM